MIKAAGIEPKMVNSLQLRELGVQIVYLWFWQECKIFSLQSFTPVHSIVNKSIYRKSGKFSCMKIVTS